MSRLFNNGNINPTSSNEKRASEEADTKADNREGDDDNGTGEKCGVGMMAVARSKKDCRPGKMVIAQRRFTDNHTYGSHHEWSGVLLT